MSQNKVVSFRASGHFLNWLEAQTIDDESPSQAAMRILKALSTGESVDVSTTVSTEMSTRSTDSFVSTDLSTNISTIVDTQLASKLDPMIKRLANMEERLGKLKA
jgi:hypothetical protein